MKFLVNMYRVALKKHAEVIQEINELSIKLAEQYESVKGGTSAKQGLEYMFTTVHKTKTMFILPNYHDTYEDMNNTIEGVKEIKSTINNRIYVIKRSDRYFQEIKLQLPVLRGNTMTTSERKEV